MYIEDKIEFIKYVSFLIRFYLEKYISALNNIFMIWILAVWYGYYCKFLYFAGKFLPNVNMIFAEQLEDLF